MNQRTFPYIPLDGIEPDAQAKILACIPKSESVENGLTLRGLIALFEGIKRYGPLSYQLIAADSIPKMIAAEAEHRRLMQAIRDGDENPDCPELVIAGLEAKIALNEAELAYLEILDAEEALKAGGAK